MQNKFQPNCEDCHEPLILVEHYEYDGVTECGSYEPYYECVNGCLYPTEPRIDTCTEYGQVILEGGEAIII